MVWLSGQKYLVIQFLFIQSSGFGLMGLTHITTFSQKIGLLFVKHPVWIICLFWSRSICGNLVVLKPDLVSKNQFSSIFGYQDFKSPWFSIFAKLLNYRFKCRLIPCLMWFLTIVRLIRIQVRAWLPNLVPNIVFLFCNLVPKNDTSSPQIYIYCSKFAIWLKRHVNRKNIGLCNFNFSVTKYIKHLRIYQNKIKDCDLSRI